jgi:uncharacterized protein (DUF433 family)
MQTQVRYTTSQTAAMLGWTVDKLNRARRNLLPAAKATEKTAQRTYDYRDLRFLVLAKKLDRFLTPDGQHTMFKRIKAMKPTETVLIVADVPIDLGPVDAELETAIRKLDDIREGIVEKAGDAYFKDTEISVYRIAALSHGLTVAQIIEDYPSLKSGQVERAIAFAKATPKKGKPYPATTLKRALGDLAALGAFDLEDSAGEALP